MKKIIIIGGGISGLCTAYYLVKEGCEVIIIDQSDISKGASFINAGYLTPSHFIPIAEPGIISKGLKWMLNSSSPFYVQPRLDMEFLQWAWNFKKSATQKKVEKAIPVLIDLNLKSQKLFEEILSSHDFEFHYEHKGILMAYQSEKGKEHEINLAKRAVDLGLEATEIGRDELQKIQPVFSDKVIGAVHYTCDSHTTPNQFMKNLKQWLQLQGVTFLLNQKVKFLKTRDDKIVSVTIDNEILEADEFVLSAGTWSSALAKTLNLNIPIQAGKGYSMDVCRQTGITLPAILVEAKVAVTPMKDFTRFAGTMEFSGINNVIRKPRVEAIAKSAASFYKDLKINEEEKDSAVSGMRPVSPDGLPYIGKTLKYSNLNIAAGHAMMGWSLGPITGKLICENIMGLKNSVDLRNFKPERF